LLTDPGEVMSFASRPRSKAVGAQPGVGGVILTSQEVNLTAQFNFQSDKTEHSAQFNYTIQRAWPFYRQLGVTLQVLSPPTP